MGGRGGGQVRNCSSSVEVPPGTQHSFLLRLDATWQRMREGARALVGAREGSLLGTSKEMLRFDCQWPVGRIAWKQSTPVCSKSPGKAVRSKHLFPILRHGVGGKGDFFFLIFAAEKFYKANPRSLMPPPWVFFFLFQPPHPAKLWFFLVCLVYRGDFF